MTDNTSGPDLRQIAAVATGLHRSAEGDLDEALTELSELRAALREALREATEFKDRALAAEAELAARPNCSQEYVAWLKSGRHQVQELHRSRYVQVGSETHGGPPQYGEVCVRCHVIAPCPTIRALNEGAHDA